MPPGANVEVVGAATDATEALVDETGELSVSAPMAGLIDGCVA